MPPGKVKKQSTGICYLCGKEGLMTIDHVPPHCLAPKALNSIFYKLPACKTCNKALTDQESRFRDYVVAYAKDGIQEAADAFDNMQSNFARGKGRRGGLPNQDFYRLYNNEGISQLISPAAYKLKPVWKNR